jgi:hypothetical protein
MRHMHYNGMHPDVKTVVPVRLSIYRPTSFYELEE